MGRLLALVAALVMGALMAWAAQQPPRPAPADAPAVVFSAERAMADVAAIGRVPHPTGSAANLAARDHLLARMAALGLRPTVWRGQALELNRGTGGPAVFGANAEDLVGVLPGRDRAKPAVALMAHYDSVPASPGAADDAAGVAAVLETVRAIETRGAPARDVMVVLTDGEEVGEIGARAFFANHPLARHIGFVLNFETRGSAGRALMFETGAGDGGTIALLRRIAARPSAQSLFAFAYQRMPNDTDFTVAKHAGLGGLNYAFIGREFDYHTATATPPRVDRGALQDLGDQALAAASGAAYAPQLPARSPDVVYGSVFGHLVIAYPPFVGWLVLAAAAALLVLAIRRAQRSQPLSPWDALRGAAAALYALACAAAVLQTAREATGVGSGYLEQWPLLAQAGRWEAACALLAIGVLLFTEAELARGRRWPAVALPLAAAAISGLLVRGFEPVGMTAGIVAAALAAAAFGRPAARPGAWAGVLGLGLALGVIAQASTPLAAYALGWPLLAGALAAAATALGMRRDSAALAALAVIAAVSLAWVGGLAHLLYLGLGLPPLLAAPLLLAAFTLWPLAQPGEGAPPARRTGGLLMVVGLAVVALVRLDPPHSARYPQLSDVAYLLDQDTGRAWRLNLAPGLSPWTRGVLTGDGGAIVELRHWLFSDTAEAAAATPVSEPAPAITLGRLPDGGLRLHAAPIAGGRVFALRLSADTPMTLATVNGVPAGVRMAPGGWTRVRWEASPDGLDLVLAPAGPGRLQVRYVDTLERWPAGARPLPPRPADVMPFDLSDSTLVVGSRSLTW